MGLPKGSMKEMGIFIDPPFSFLYEGVTADGSCLFVRKASERNPKKQRAAQAVGRAEVEYAGDVRKMFSGFSDVVRMSQANNKDDLLDMRSKWFGL